MKTFIESNSPSTPKLLTFVYNANSGLVFATLDSIHKLFSPKTYKCDLCKLTYGLTRMNSDWKTYVDRLKKEGYVLVFLHKDELLDSFPKYDLPHILLNGKLLVSRVDMAACSDAACLIAILEKKLVAKRVKTSVATKRMTNARLK